MIHRLIWSLGLLCILVPSTLLPAQDETDAQFEARFRVGPRDASQAPTFNVWPSDVPGETGAVTDEALQPPKDEFKRIRRMANVSQPTVTVFRAPKDKDTGVSVVICPGGGYNILAMDLEGTEVADWLNSIGVTGIVLKYRVPRRADLPKHLAPLQDAQRAVSLVRANAEQWNLRPDRIGILGFSAGGHLSATAATNFDQRQYDPVDEVDQVSCRPDFAVLVYPAYLTEGDGLELAPEIRVSENTPPTFFAHAGDDRISPKNSIAMFLALKDAGVPADLHVYAGGGHGFGLRLTEMPCSTWPARCEQWMRQQGILGEPKIPDTMSPDSPVTFPERGALPSKYPPDAAVETYPVEPDYFLTSSPPRSLEQIGQIQQELPKGEFTPPVQDWQHLPKTYKTLTEGGDLHIFGLGDSIVNDTFRSGWIAKLAAAYPQANIRGTLYVRGGGGCRHYRYEERIQKYLTPFKPDLVFIGGISQQQDYDAIRDVIQQIRRDLPECEILLATGVFGTVDPRRPDLLVHAPHSGSGAYGKQLWQIAREQNCGFLDMTTPWAEYIRSTGLHPHTFYRDRVHANEAGEQILSQILLSFFR